MTERFRLATHDTFRSLDNRNFRLFFGGQIVSQAGTWMQSVAIVWVVLELTGSGLALGLVTAAEFLPVLVLGAWAGVIADRVDHHRMMIVTQAAFMALAFTLSALTLTGTVTVPALFVLALVFGTINAFDNPSRRALVVELVPETAVPNAVGLNSALMTGSRVIGPAIAGLLIAGPGAGTAFAGTATTFTLLFATLSVGSVAGALVVARQSDMNVGFLVRAGAGLAVSTAALALAPTLPLALLAALAVGFTNVEIVSGANAVVQLRAAPDMRGRVLALLGAVFLGSTPIGSPIIGFVAETLGPRVAIGVGGLATALVVAWTARSVRALGPAGEARAYSTVGTGAADPGPDDGRDDLDPELAA